MVHIIHFFKLLSNKRLVCCIKGTRDSSGILNISAVIFFQHDLVEPLERKHKNQIAIVEQIRYPCGRKKACTDYTGEDILRKTYSMRAS